MDERERFTTIWTEESKTTRTVLSRIPEDSDYKPDPDSRTAKTIAWQILCEEKMIIDALENGKAEWAPPDEPATMKGVLEAYEAQSSRMPARWAALSPAQWDVSFDLFGGLPAVAMAWNVLLDIVHHRGQVSTYLRPMGAKVPQIYGPSFDEP